MKRLSKKFARITATVALSALIGLNSAGVALAAPAAAGATPDPKAVMMYNLGITAYRQGSTDAAVIFFKRACDIDPNLADAQYNLAVIYQAQHRYKEAIPRFEEVLRLKANDPDAHFQLGVVLQESGRYLDARQHFSSIAPNNPHFAEAQRRLIALNNAPATQIAAPALQQAPQQAGAMAATASALQPPIADGTPVGNGYVPPAQPPVDQAVAQQPPVQAAPAAYQYAAQPQVSAQPPEGAQSPAAQSPTPGEQGANTPIPVQANTSLRIVATGFSAPAGLTFDKSGNLYVANYSSNTIERITPEGTRTLFTSGANLRGPIGLVADDAGNLYVANYNGGTVAKVNPAGVSTIIAQGFKQPYYLTLDKDGNLYVSQQADNSIVRITLKTTTASKAP